MPIRGLLQEIVPTFNYKKKQGTDPLSSEEKETTGIQNGHNKSVEKEAVSLVD